MSRLSTRKTLIATTDYLAEQTLPLLSADLDTAVIQVGDWDSARVYFEYTGLNLTSQLSVQVKASHTESGTMFNIGLPVLTDVGATSKFQFIDIDISNACEIQCSFQEVGNAGTPGTVSASLVVSYTEASD